MPERIQVTGVFEVNAGAVRDVDVVVDGLTVDQIAEALYAEAEGVSLCHQCAGEMDDPELGQLVQIEFGGHTYVPDDNGGWALYGGRSSGGDSQ